MNAKLSLIVLCSLFAFTLTVLLIFYLYKKLFYDFTKMDGIATYSANRKKYKYNMASQQDDNYVINNLN
jgi:hypothetical protein